MTRSVTALAALILAAALAGCGLLKEDEHKDWTAEQFYTAAKEVKVTDLPNFDELPPAFSPREGQ